MNEAELLEELASITRMVSKWTPAQVGLVAGVMQAALQAAAAFARAGKDPVAEITRILSAEAEVEEVHTDWQALLDKKFGKGSAPPSSSSSGASSGNG